MGDHNRMPVICGWKRLLIESFTESCTILRTVANHLCESLVRRKDMKVTAMAATLA